MYLDELFTHNSLYTILEVDMDKCPLKLAGLELGLNLFGMAVTPRHRAPCAWWKSQDVPFLVAFCVNN